MGVMEGKNGVVIGVANDRSYAYFIAEALKSQGAGLLFTHLPGEKMARRAKMAIKSLYGEGEAEPWVAPLDATNEEEMAARFAAAAEQAGGKLDFLVHSIAFADRRYLEIGNFVETPKDVYLQALEISSYTLLSMARAVRPFMKDGGAIIAMSFYGAEKVSPGYNVMGVAKAALESTGRYLAAELGRNEPTIRVNIISGGPLRTLSAMGVGGFPAMLDIVAKRNPIGRNIEGPEVGATAAFLLSDLASGITGQTIYVDGGYSSMGM